MVVRSWENWPRPSLLSALAAAKSSLSQSHSSVVAALKKKKKRLNFQSIKLPFLQPFVNITFIEIYGILCRLFTELCSCYSINASYYKRCIIEPSTDLSLTDPERAALRDTIKGPISRIVHFSTHFIIKQEDARSNGWNICT